MTKSEEILQRLELVEDVKYKEFNQKIVPTRQRVLGIRVPLLREIAKEIAKDNPNSFLEEPKPNIHEMVFLEGLTLSYMKKSFQELLPLLEKYLLKVDNWAQIDSVMAGLKSVKKEKESTLLTIKRWLHSEHEFVVRSGLVLLLLYYVEEENLEMIFQLSESVVHQGYYVKMANAWLLSVCMAKFPEPTLLFFQKNSLDVETHNKALQKSRESFRVSKEHKEVLKKLKRG